MITSTSVVIVLCWLVFQTSTHSPHLSPGWSGMARAREASGDSTLSVGCLSSDFARAGGAGSVPRPGLGQGRNQHATKASGTLACDGPNLHNEPPWRTLASHPANAYAHVHSPRTPAAAREFACTHVAQESCRDAGQGTTGWPRRTAAAGGCYTTGVQTGCCLASSGKRSKVGYMPAWVALR